MDELILLDTDHFSALQVAAGERRVRLMRRLQRARGEEFAVTVITLEEQMRGWLAEIAHTPDLTRHVGAYSRLVELVSFFGVWEITGFSKGAAAHCLALRKEKVRIGTMNMKIASIATREDALLLTANTKDFSLAPGLRFENWLE